jgi:hypothetical protein
MKSFVRDSTVRSIITFKDDGRCVVIPASATLTFSYVPIGGGCERTFTTFALVASGSPLGSTWLYDWDSSVAAPGVVSGHAETVGLPQRSTVDFDFRLTANYANRELTGEV